MNPFKYQLSADPDDPFLLKSKAKWSPRRILWTLQSRVLEHIAERGGAEVLTHAQKSRLRIFEDQRGATLEDTAVSYNQMKLLLAALDAAREISGDVAEIGSYRGVTTAALAKACHRRVLAIDPFIGYGGSSEDFAAFKHRTNNLSNIEHLRKTSGEAARLASRSSFVLVFVDAIHDVSNSWFDLCSWAPCVVNGGFLALHDVDDHAGSSYSARRFIASNPQFVPWAYCPNLLVLRRQ